MPNLLQLAVAAVSESGNKSPRLAALLLRLAACATCEDGPVVGALLFREQQGPAFRFGYLLGNGIASVSAPDIVPGVKSWLLTFTVAASQPRLGTALFISTDPALAQYSAAIKIFPSNTPPSMAQIYIVDGAGVPINPAAVQAVAPNAFFGIQITAQLAGSESGFEP